MVRPSGLRGAGCSPRVRRRTSRPAGRPSPPDQGSAPPSSSPTPLASGPGHPGRGRTWRESGPAWALGLALVALTGAPALAAGDGKPIYVERGEASYYGPACTAGGWPTAGAST